MGGKTSTTTQQVTIPKEVMDRYNAINARAETVAAKPFQIYSMDPSKFVAQLNQQQQVGIENVNQAAGSYAPYFEKAYGSATAGMQSAQPQDLNLDQFYNPYQQQVIDATMRQMTQANEQAQSGALGTAISSGAFGGDRAGIAAANLANQQGLAMGSTLAGLNAQNYNQALAAAQQQQGVELGATQADLARLMQGGQFYAGLGQAAQQAGLQGAEAQINAGTLGQQTEQAGLTALYNQFMQQQAYPFQVAQFLANIGMGTGALSGSTTTSTQPAPFFSDRRLKEDVERIGESDEGLPIYKYRYKGEPETHIGFMADEVEKVHPEAVGVHPTGYKTVDYDRAAKAGGGVAGPYGAMVGSQPGMGSYVPEAYLPVGELMVADSSMMDQSNQSLASMMDSANRFGDSLSGLYDKYGMVKEELNKWREKQREQASATPGTPSRAYGGGVRPAYAYGGDAAYLRTASSGEQPVEKKTYLSDVLDSQSKRDDTIPTAKGDLAAPRSAAQDIADLGKVALAFMGMNRGGVAGYQAGGAPTATDEREREAGVVPPSEDRIIRLPEQPSTPAMTLPEGSPTTIPRKSPLAPDVSQRPAPRPAGVAAAAPVAAPAAGALPDGVLMGLAGGAIERAAQSAQPQATGVAAAAPTVSASQQIDPREFFNNRIIRQESGGRQFDAEGNPLRSSAGAIGVAQVMEGTGPEAAALAGLEWDRNRWLNDAEYNRALGEAYFLEQYRRFGSLDLAAAAYNAGPGRLAQAMDRATALGGSYLDYLPEETQKYVRATTGMGGSGVSPRRTGSAAPDGGDRGDTTFSGGVREFLDRNKSNPDFLLSVLSGLGTMASSPSLYLGSAVLQGIGGAANTYMAREQQRADITAKNLENMRNVAMDTMQWNELNGTNLTPAQYAKAMGMTLQIPENASAQDILSGTAYTPTTGGGAGIDKVSFGDLQSGTVSIDGKTVRMQDDPNSLRRFINDNALFPPDSPIGRQVAAAQQKLAEIEGRGGVTFDVDGNEVVVPSYVAAGNTQAQNQANREASIQFRNTGIERMPVIDQQLAETDKQALIFTRLEAGALTNEMTSAAAVMDALGLPAPEGMVADKALAQEAIKLATSKMIAELGNMPGGAPAEELNRLAQIAADPNLQPEAVKMILTMQKAALLREQDRYRLRDQWNRENPDKAFDQYAYEEWFAQNRPYTTYYEEVKKSMPLFAGEEVTAENAPIGSTSVDASGRPIVRTENGWELQ